MADLATPSAAAMGTMDASTSPLAGDGTAKLSSSKAEKPDDAEFRSAVEKARKDMADAKAARTAAEARVNAARPGNSDSPVAKQRQELRARLQAIREKQQSFKSSKAGTQDRLKVLDTQLKSKIQEQKLAKSRIPFKSADEIDSEIRRLQTQVDSGKMKLVDEKKALNDVSALHKQRKAFAGFDETQKQIDNIKTSLSELKRELDNPEYKALSDEYSKITQELDGLKVQQDEAFKNLNEHRDALTKAKHMQNEKYEQLKQLQDEYYSKKRAYNEHEREAARHRDAKRKQERDAYQQERKMRDLDTQLEDARIPAYTEEIRACNALIRIGEGSDGIQKQASGPSEFAAQAQRIVDGAGIKGTRLASKKEDDEDNYFVGSGGKRGKKSKKLRIDGEALDVSEAPSKSKNTSALLGRFYDPAAIEHFTLLSIPTPTSIEEVPAMLEKVKQKRENYQKDSPEKTKKNVEAAQKKIEMLKAGTYDETADEQSSAKQANGSDAPMVVESQAASAAKQTLGSSAPAHEGRGNAAASGNAVRDAAAVAGNTNGAPGPASEDAASAETKTTVDAAEEDVSKAVADVSLDDKPAE